MRALVNSVFQAYYSFRFKQIEYFMNNPHEIQYNVFKNLIELAENTEWGKKYHFADIDSPQDFAKQVPVQDYETIKPFIQRMMDGEKDVLWHGAVTHFSKSSGTTSDKSKFLPVSPENFKSCHIKGTWDTMTLLYHNKPDCTIFSGKNFLMAGSHSKYKPNLNTIYGDVSALMIKDMPKVARPFFEPDIDTCLLDDWESKIEIMTKVALREAKHIRMVGGVPTWIIVFFRKILEMSGKEHMLEVWPNFEAYIHGGVSIAPYRDQLYRYLPSSDVTFWEVYNASEGYFGTQSELDADDMLLLLDNGVYYEFIPMEEWNNENPKTITLEEVEVGKNYAILITTNSGLWRYKIGDTLSFTSTTPYKFKITGRTKQFVNAFGEEVMVSNTDKALELTCREINAVVSEYTVAPVFFKGSGKGGHEWLIEFDQPPVDITAFNQLLDKNLQKINSDYEAKRYKDMALEQLLLRSLPKGTFLNWLKSKGKYGNQNKVPRLANNRQYVEEILDFTKKIPPSI